jgi:nucleotide-binding universal stress UspA family protein
MPKPILVGVDDTPAALRAAALASDIARAAEFECRAIHVVPDLWRAAGVPELPLPTQDLTDRLVSEARVRLVRLLEPVVPPDVARGLDVRVGRAGPVLARAASEAGAALVAVGGNHHSALARAFGGSTAHYLLHTLEVPMLVAGPVAARVRRILVAVDLSYATAPALATARRLAAWLGARLRVLHVVEPVLVPVEVPVTVDQEELMRRSREAYDELVTGQLGLPPEDRVIRSGAAAETIAAEAAAFEADLVVLGSHGKGWVDRLLVGSVTEDLVNLLPTSLVIVPVSPFKRRGGARRAGATQLEVSR